MGKAASPPRQPRASGLVSKGFPLALAWRGGLAGPEFRLTSWHSSLTIYQGASHMAVTPKILAFAGSTRAESYNKKLVQIAIAGARAAGAEVTYLDLRDLPMPLFDEDLEKADGLPANARRLKDLFLAHHGLLISAPEYNSSITAALKNAIDWVSRPCQGEAPLGCFVDKVA